MKSLQGGFYFHPKDKNPSLGARLREKATRRACHWVQLESVINLHVACAGRQFFRYQGARSDEYRVSASDERHRDRENWPQPSGLRRKSGAPGDRSVSLGWKSAHTSLSSSPWNGQSLRPPPRLIRFSLATQVAGKLITGSSLVLLSRFTMRRAFTRKGACGKTPRWCGSRSSMVRVRSRWRSAHCGEV